MAVAGLVLGVPGWLEYRVLQGLATVLGLAVTAVVLPVAYVRARRGERVAFYMLMGWGFYVCGAFTTAGVLRGYIEPTFWTQYLYPFSTMVEMSAWMAVLGLRVQAIHRTADRARLESETQRALGPHRRADRPAEPARAAGKTGTRTARLHAAAGAGGVPAGPGRLQARQRPLRPRCRRRALLVAVGQRLQGQLRGSDVGGTPGRVTNSWCWPPAWPTKAPPPPVGQKLLAAR